MRDKLRNVCLIIIDEISMVSNVTLQYINLRLCEIFDILEHPDGWFARINILFLGDLMQLHPVNEPSPFVNMSKQRFQKHLIT